MTHDAAMSAYPHPSIVIMMVRLDTDLENLNLEGGNWTTGTHGELGGTVQVGVHVAVTWTQTYKVPDWKIVFSN